MAKKITIVQDKDGNDVSMQSFNVLCEDKSTQEISTKVLSLEASKTLKDATNIAGFIYGKANNIISVTQVME